VSSPIEIKSERGEVGPTGCHYRQKLPMLSPRQYAEVAPNAGENVCFLDFWAILKHVPEEHGICTEHSIALFQSATVKLCHLTIEQLQDEIQFFCLHIHFFI
jgi:hypothetical protein